jgi:mannose-1-phosphate guanylyltransferase
MSRWAVVLAGGVGSRFWPLSTPSRPKQLLPLVSSQPLLADTAARLRPIVSSDRTLILTSEALVPSVATLLADVPASNILAEPRPAGTAAALTWAAQEIARRDGPAAVMMSVHADWAVADPAGFQNALTLAAQTAEKHHALVTVGIVPTRPDPGFGYIQPGEGLDAETGARRVARFVEKPDRARAEQMRRDGYLWNSGIFVWRVGDFLDDVRRLTPEVSRALHANSDDMLGFFGAVTPISVDVGVLERSNRVVVLAGDFGWDDVGTWGALRRVRRPDAAGNTANGRLYAIDSRDNVVHAPGSTVVMYGVSNLVVVMENDMLLVTTTERSSDLKTLMDALPRGVRERP